MNLQNNSTDTKTSHPESRTPTRRRARRERRRSAAKKGFWSYAKIGFLLFDAILACILLERWLGPPSEKKQEIINEVVVRHVPVYPSPSEKKARIDKHPANAAKVDPNSDKIMSALAYIEEKGNRSQNRMNQAQASAEDVYQNMEDVVPEGARMAGDLASSAASIPSSGSRFLSDSLPSSKNLGGIASGINGGFPGSSGESSQGGLGSEDNATLSGGTALTSTEQRYAKQAAYIYEELGVENSEHYSLFRKLLSTYDDPKILNKENWPVLLAEKSYNQMSLTNRYPKGVPPNGFTFQETKYSASDAGEYSSAKKAKATRTALKITPFYQQTKSRLQDDGTNN